MAWTPISWRSVALLGAEHRHGLLKHLAACEVYRFGWDLDGSRPDAPFDEPGHGHGWALESAHESAAADQYALYDTAVAAPAGGPGRPWPMAAWTSGSP